MSVGRDAEREQLADALVAGVGGQVPPGHVWNLDKALEPLLPLIDRIANDRAAAALRAAADACDRIGVPAQGAVFRARAYQLDPS